MGIDAEDLLVCLWKFIRFFIDTTHVCAQKHPFVSSTLFIIFLCYVFFDLLLHHFPLLVFLAVLLRIFWSSEGQEPSTRHVDKDEDPDSVAEEESKTDTLSSYRRQKSRRTLFSKHRSLLVSPKNDANLDVVRERAKSDEDDEEISDNNHNHAVEWNENDQRNLDDLGVSEIERNRRLESLIAKRRARKVVVKPRRGSGGNSPAVVLPISVAKESRLVNRASEGSLSPGSAPSVLVRSNNKNPFDIPYDPTEEKPDLTVGSFQEEFTAAASQKDGVSFCHHESFCWAGFGFEPEKGLSRSSSGNDAIEQFVGPTKSQIAHMPSITESDQSQCQTQSLDTETSLDSTVTTTNDIQGPPNDTEITNNSDATEIETEPSITEDSETNSSYSLEASNRSIEGTATAEAQYDTSPTTNDRNDDDDERSFGSLASHTPSYSIASDMQVEVSEIGSAPLTVGNVSPIDGDSLSFDEELERGHLNYDIQSLDARGVAEEKKQKSAMRFAEELSSHPFFESSYKASKEAIDSGSENHAKQDDSEEATDDMTITSEEADSGSNVHHIEQAITTEDADLNVANSEEENTREVSSLVRDDIASCIDPNSPASKFDQLVIRQESFLVNKSSPSSPMCTPIGRVPINYALSSNYDRRIPIDAMIDRSFVDQQSANGNSETLEEPSASGKICEDIDIGLNIIESTSEDTKGKEETGSTTHNREEGKEWSSESATESSQ